MVEILAHAMPVVDPTATGVHLAWLGPTPPTGLGRGHGCAGAGSHSSTGRDAGFRLAGGTTSLRWIGSRIEDFAAVIDLPSPARTFRFELEPGHSLTLEAGFAWGSSFSAAIAIPSGPVTSVTLLTPANHLRLGGKGFPAALIVEPEADMQVIQVLPSILLADTPRIAPPWSASGCRSRQFGQHCGSRKLTL